MKTHRPFPRRCLALLLYLLLCPGFAAGEEAITPAEWYRQAEQLVAEEQFFDAMLAYEQAWEHPGAREKALLIRRAYEGSLSVGDTEIAVLHRDGTASFDSLLPENIDSWWGMTAVSAHNSYVIGLTDDGDVIPCRWYVGNWDADGSYHPNRVLWWDIAAISAGQDHLVALRKDGTVAAMGSNDSGQCNVEGWTDIIAVSAGTSHTVGLRRDGTVVAVGQNHKGQCDVEGWTDIIAVDAGDVHTVGLRRDGTVVACGMARYGQCDVGGWTGIAAVAAGSCHTLGLRRDGTVVACGSNQNGVCEVDGWTDVVMLSAGSTYNVVMHRDGTLSGKGLFCRELPNWRECTNAGPYTRALLRALGE